jgi:hypothetical protein
VADVRAAERGRPEGDLRVPEVDTSYQESGPESDSTTGSEVAVRPGLHGRALTNLASSDFEIRESFDDWRIVIEDLLVFADLKITR